MPAYDDKLFALPAPVARVMLRNPESGVTIDEVGMLIDSGADVTLLPPPMVELLGIQPSTETGYELEGFDGSTSASQVVRADLIFLRKTFRGQFLLVNQPEQDWGILGRDVMNHLSLLLDGPNRNWEEHRLA